MFLVAQSWQLGFVQCSGSCVVLSARLCLGDFLLQEGVLVTGSSARFSMGLSIVGSVLLLLLLSTLLSLFRTGVLTVV